MTFCVNLVNPKDMTQSLHGVTFKGNTSWLAILEEQNILSPLLVKH